MCQEIATGWKSAAGNGNCRSMSALTELAPGRFGSGLASEEMVAALVATPGVQRVPSPKLTLFLRRQFLAPATCTALIAKIDATRRPSTISDSNGDAYYRTSETCDLD